jgi:hypothetical protein
MTAVLYAIVIITSINSSSRSRGISITINNCNSVVTRWQ